MLGQRRRRWTNINQHLFNFLVCCDIHVNIHDLDRRAGTLTGRCVDSKCRPTVCDVGPTLDQHWINIPCDQHPVFVAYMLLLHNVVSYWPSVADCGTTLFQHCFTVSFSCETGTQETRHSHNVGTMLAHRLRRCPNIVLILLQRFVLLGDL